MDTLKLMLEQELAKTKPDTAVVKVLAEQIARADTEQTKVKAEADRDREIFGFAMELKRIESRTAMWSGLLR